MKSLTNQEEQVLESLVRFGALTPSEISVKTYLLPDEVDSILKELHGEGLVKSLALDSRSSTLEQEACTLTPKGRQLLKA